MPPGEYRFGNAADGTMFRSDGKVGWAPNGSLASSIVGMDHMVRHMKRSTSASLSQVIRMASLTPAERTGIADQTGSLEVGKQADILVMDKELNVVDVFVGGLRVSDYDATRQEEFDSLTGSRRRWQVVNDAVPAARG